MDPSAMMGPPYYAMPMYNHMPMYFQGGYGYPPYYSPAGGPGPFIYSPSPVQHPHAAPPAAMPPPPPATSADSAEMLLISLASSPANGADGQYFADGTGVRSPKRSKLGATSVDDPTPPSTYERYAGPPAHDRYTAPPPSEGYTGLEALSIAASNTMA